MLAEVMYEARVGSAAVALAIRELRTPLSPGLRVTVGSKEAPGIEYWVAMPDMMCERLDAQDVSISCQESQSLRLQEFSETKSKTQINNDKRDARKVAQRDAR